MRKVADLGLAVGIPLHSHIALNYVLTDYLPKASQGMMPNTAPTTHQPLGLHALPPQVLHGGGCLDCQR